jgi:uncharacterized protein YciI
MPVRMNHYAVHFEDDPGQLAVREAHLEAHKAYLSECSERLLSAGFLTRDGAGGPVGGWWLVRAASELEVRELVEADPYFVHGLRRSVRVWRYLPVLQEPS